MSIENRHRKTDRVVLDVGGTHFVTSISTLSFQCDYFASLFRTEWGYTNEEELDQSEMPPLFVDQDPEPFRILLSFMRKGWLYATDLSIDVLSLADFLGMSKLLMAVKIRAFQNMHPEFVEDDDEAISRFDLAYQTIMGAISAGVLPLYLTTCMNRRKEFVSLVISVDSVYQNNLPGGLHAGVFAAKKTYAPLEQTQQHDMVPNCSTFLDALNWLGRQGFTTEERSLAKYYAFSDRALNEIVLSRESFSVQRNVQSSSLSCMILEKVGSHSDQSTSRGIGGRREFAMITYDKIHRSSLLADLGRPTEVEYNRNRFITRIESVEDVDVIGEAMSWLHRHGYTERETMWEDFYSTVLNKAQVSAGRECLIFSRPFECKDVSNGIVM
mmetsp:Transcript_28525/g.44364  ORF Transcript_28525/g.44364 Transcript_28525/m.44364 type:complete len:384 (+) Transcript_28525:112-1263(+)